MKLPDGVVMEILPEAGVSRINFLIDAQAKTTGEAAAKLAADLQTTAAWLERLAAIERSEEPNWGLAT